MRDISETTYRPSPTGKKNLFFIFPLLTNTRTFEGLVLFIVSEVLALSLEPVAKQYKMAWACQNKLLSQW